MFENMRNTPRDACNCSCRSHDRHIASPSFERISKRTALDISRRPRRHFPKGMSTLFFMRRITTCKRRGIRCMYLVLGEDRSCSDLVTFWLGDPTPPSLRFGGSHPPSPLPATFASLRWLPLSEHTAEHFRHFCAATRNVGLPNAKCARC